MAETSRNNPNVPDDREHSRAVVAVLAVVGGALCVVLLVLRVLPLDVSGEWLWPQNPAPRWDELAAVFAVFILFAGCTLCALSLWSSATRAQRAAAIAVLSALAGVLWLSSAKLSPAGLYEMPFAVAVPKSNAYFFEATTVKSLKAYLAAYEEASRQGPFRVQLSTHPAGPVVMFYAVQQLFRWSPLLTERTLGMASWLAPPEGDIEASLVQGLLPAERSLRAAAWASAFILILCAVLALPALYALCARLISPTAGVIAVGFFAPCPALHLFSPALDQTLVLLAILVVWLLFMAVEKNSWAMGLGVGVLVVVALQFSISLVVVVAVGAGTLALTRFSLRRGLPIRALIGAAGGLAIFSGLLAVLFDYNTLEVWIECARQNAHFNRLAGRAYGSWLALNVIEWAVFLGMPAAVLSGASAVRRSRCAVAVALYVILLILNVTGANRGEVGRLWMPLMPLACVAAAAELDDFAHKRAWFAPLLTLQFAGMVALKLSVDALGLYQIG